MSIEDNILKHALINAIKFNGTANPGSIVGQLIKDDPLIKSKLAELQPKIQEIVTKVNSMSLDEQKKELETNFPGALGETPKKAREGLKDLPNVEGKVIMRFAPSPSGPLHIGHALTMGVIDSYCKRYNGKFIFRIEDTNSDNIYEPAYEIMPMEANWLTGNNVSEVIIQSDRLEIYYRYLEKFFEIEKIYVCTCDADTFREFAANKTACPCRDISKQENLIRWKKMFNEYKQGDAVVRVKTDMAHINPAMRDFPIFRINESNHPRQGTTYRVWPLMNFSVFVDDVELGMTHVIRGKDHTDNAKRQQYLYNYLNKKQPVSLFHGRVNFIDMPVSCSKTKKAIAEGKYTGWTDIRLPFLGALKKRGYQPKALLKWAESIGISLNDKTVSKNEFYKTINAFNKEIIEKTSNRYFFVEDPVKINVESAPNLDINMQLHPDYPKRGFRSFKTSNEFYIAKSDNDKIKDEIFRLIDCINIEKKGNRYAFHSKDYEIFKDKGNGKIIQFLPVSNDLINVDINMDDGRIISGLAEKTITNLEPNQTIQFERFAFVTLEEKRSDKFIFNYLHN